MPCYRNTKVLICFQRDDTDPLWKPRRRAFSCSISRRQSNMSLKAILSSSRTSSHTLQSSCDLAEECEKAEERPKRHEEVFKLINRPAEQTSSSETSHKDDKLSKKSNCDIAEGSRQNFYVHLDSNKAHRKLDNEEIAVKQVDSKCKNAESIPYHLKRTHRRSSSAQKSGQEVTKSDGISALRDLGDGRSSRERDTFRSESESEENTIETRSEFSDTVIEISDEDMNFGYNELPRHSGPINKNLRDLYCSNYLEHKLELLKVEESRLSEEMTTRTYGISCRDRFDDIDEGEIAGGVLI